MRVRNLLPLLILNAGCATAGPATTGLVQLRELVPPQPDADAD